MGKSECSYQMAFIWQIDNRFRAKQKWHSQNSLIDVHKFSMQVLTLKRYCPQESPNVTKQTFTLDHRAQEAVIALGLYFLESGCQHEKEIVPYLIELNEALPLNAVWADDGKPKKTDRE